MYVNRTFSRNIKWAKPLYLLFISIETPAQTSNGLLLDIPLFINATYI